MIDFIKELIWAIGHDADTKIIVSIILACSSIAVSVVAIVLNVLNAI